MALRKALHCAVDGEDDEGSKHHFPLGLHNGNNREHAASGVNSSSLFIRWSAQLRQPFLCAPSSDNGTRLPHHSPNQTERGGHRSISYLSAYGWDTLHPAITPEEGQSRLRGIPPLYVARRGVRIGSRFGGEAEPTRGQCCTEPERRSAAVPLFGLPWRIEGLVSLHVQGRRKE